MSYTKENAIAYVGRNVETDEKEMRIKLNGVDYYLGTGLIDDENPTIEESKAVLKDDKNWRDRIILLDMVSKTTNKPYKMVILSNIVVDEVLDF